MPIATAGTLPACLLRFAIGVACRNLSDEMALLSSTAIFARRFAQSRSRILSHRFSGAQWLGLSTASPRSDFGGGNAYELLGVSQTSSFPEIKDSFRKLAKATHPDLADPNDSGASQRFIQILAAYEILSDVNRRAHYDQYLLSQKKVLQKIPTEGSVAQSYRTFTTSYRQMEVVEWLKWYRCAVNEIVSEKKVVTGTGYFDVLEGDFYSAINAAYYGPEIESMELLPECFEAEERSVYDTPEVLHLVSGRDLFGMVCLANNVPELSYTFHEKLAASCSVNPDEEANICTSSTVSNDDGTATVGRSCTKDRTSDAYRDLELHISGRLVATATRMPPQSSCNGIRNDATDDQIHVFLISSDDCTDIIQEGPSSVCSKNGSRILLGTVSGLMTSQEEGSCFVYDRSGAKTHVVMMHRTFLVKHLHWYRLGGEVSICECRSTRARLPPSKFWLFEPRCGMHDIGGWYVETFGRDEKNRTVPSQRFWNGFDVSEEVDQRLHPAVYLLTLAYRTLDIEAARRKKTTMTDVMEGRVVRVLNWCKKVV